MPHDRPDLTVLAGGSAVDDLNLFMLVGSAVLLVAIVAVRVATATSLPTLLLFLGLGLLLGEDGIGISFDDHALTQMLGYAALVIILAEGGLTTSWRHVKPALPAAAVLATVGVGVSMTVTGVAAHVLLDLSWRNAFLLGAIVSSTDAAAVFSVLRLVPLRHRVAGILEAESGFNDAPVVILVITLCTSEHLSVEHLSAEIGLLVLGNSPAGAAVGIAVGFAGAAAVRRIAFPSSGLYPIAVLALATIAYGGAAMLHSSGLPRRLPRVAGPGQQRPAARPRDAWFRRRSGLVVADRAVRAARPAGHPVAARRRGAAGASASASCCCWSPDRPPSP